MTSLLIYDRPCQHSCLYAPRPTLPRIYRDYGPSDVKIQRASRWRLRLDRGATAGTRCGPLRQPEITRREKQRICTGSALRLAPRHPADRTSLLWALPAESVRDARSQTSGRRGCRGRGRLQRTPLTVCLHCTSTSLRWLPSCSSVMLIGGVNGRSIGSAGSANLRRNSPPVLVCMERLPVRGAPQNAPGRVGGGLQSSNVCVTSSPPASVKRRVIGGMPVTSGGTANCPPPRMLPFWRPGAASWRIFRARTSRLQQVVLSTVWTQPCPALQPSVVNALPSSHDGAAPDSHVNATHWADGVQTFPSSHSAAVVQHPGTATCVHPTTTLHPSRVHDEPSAQSSGVPATHPCVASHVSVPLHGFRSSQTTGTPGTHRPAAVSHVSCPVQASWSSQSASFAQHPGVGTCVHPTAG